MQVERYDRQERIPVSAATRSLLLHFASGDSRLSLPRVEARWPDLLDALGSHGLIPLAARMLNEREDDGYPPPDFVAQLWRRYEVTSVRSLMMYRRVATVLKALGCGGLEFILLKGPAVAATAYPDPSLRIFNDLDILVRQGDWSVADQILRGLGFVPEPDLPVPPPKLVPQDVPYELLYYNTRDGFLVEMHFDDVLNAGLAARDAEGFWRRSSWTVIEGVSARILSPEDQIVQLCAHMHCHRYSRLNWLSDLAFIVRDSAQRIDWDQVTAVTIQEDARVPVYYGLHLLDRLLKVSVPSEVLRAVRPDPFRRWVHELLLPEDDILSMQPLPRPVFSFYFHPVLQRLLPDLLVMGRRAEKLRYLLRLLAPPREWLVHYYHLDPSANIRIHYLLHPLKLACHVVEELCQAVAGAVFPQFHRAVGALRRLLCRASEEARATRRASAAGRGSLRELSGN